jgi:serine/threonine protein kinase
MTLCINPHCQNPKNSDSVQFCQSCGSELLLKLKYRATRVLGGGGFGKTYEVSAQGKRKVLKVLINNSPKAIELFQREAEVLSQLNHPGIPKVDPNSYFVFHPANSQEPVHCLVMELLEGRNLKEYLSQRGRPIDSESALRWLTELLQILQQVHDRGILHRDIKPQNIIFKPDGQLALIDFGAVREGTGTEFATAAASGGGTEVASHMAGGTSVVSAGYTAPEQMNGQALKQSDLYALGRTFMFLLTGKEPSQIPYDAYNDVPKWRQYASGLDSRLADLLDRMQSSSVRQRPENAQAVLRDLNPSRQASQVEDIAVELTITHQEAEQGVSKQVTFYRTVYPNGNNSSPKQEAKTLTVNIPANSKSGTRLRLKGQGNHDINGDLGDVYVQLIVSPVFNPNPIPLPTPDKRTRNFPAKIVIVIFLVGIGLLSAFYLNQPGYYACTCNRQPECVHRRGTGEAASTEITPFGEKYNDGNSSRITIKKEDVQADLRQAELEGFVCTRS